MQDPAKTAYVVAPPPGGLRRLIDGLFRLVFKIGYRVLAPLGFIPGSTNGGVCIVVWHGSAVLLIRHSYRPGIDVPGGILRKNETPVDGAVRELAEETGISIGPETVTFGGQVPPYRPRPHIRISYFETILADYVPPMIDNREVIWADFVDADEALKLDLLQPLRRILQQSERFQARSASPETDDANLVIQGLSTGSEGHREQTETAPW